MSSKETYKRRYVIQKLDFENCIISNIKTTRGRKKLRARITREIEHVSDISEDEKPLNFFPEPTQEAPGRTSPVLIKRQCNRKSPVFLKKKKNSEEEDIKESLEDSTIEETSSSPGSPVFKSFKKHKRGKVSLNLSQNFQDVVEGKSSLDMLNSQRNSTSGLLSSIEIDDFTQESKESVKISTVESTDAKDDNICIYPLEAAPCHSPAQLTEKLNIREKFERPKSIRRNYKKNSLLGRLHKLKQKQASEKRLWQYLNREKTSTGLRVLINSIWKEDFNYFFKCQSMVPDSEFTYLIIDSRWVPNIKKVKEGSVLQLHPPWQKLLLEESAMTVLLNVICLDVLDETKEPVVQKKATQSVPTNMFETNKNLFLDSLFSSSANGLLC